MSVYRPENAIELWLTSVTGQWSRLLKNI
jgi:hypothetical protein